VILKQLISSSGDAVRSALLVTLQIFSSVQVSVSFTELLRESWTS
jgi:hypothetical protein